jgi:hypothetical protein
MSRVGSGVAVAVAEGDGGEVRASAVGLLVLGAAEGTVQHASRARHRAVAAKGILL